MGATTDHALGRNLRFFSKKETAVGGAYGETLQEALAGTDAAKVLTTSMEFTVARNPRMDARTTRAVQERITGKQEISWSCESYLLPAGSTTAPDIDPLIEAAMGGSFGGSTAKTYKLTNTNALPTCRIARTANEVFREDLFGAWVEEMSISASGGEEPKISFSGGAMNYALTGTGQADGAGSSTAALSVHSGEGVNFMVGSVIALNSAERTVKAKTGADALTLSSNHSWSDDNAVTPSTYTETVSLHPPVNGIGGSLSLGGTSVPITGIEFTMTNGIKPFSDQALTKGTEDFVAGYRTCTGTVTIRARKDLIRRFAQRYVQLTATADPTFTADLPSAGGSDFEIVATFGTTSGYTVVLTILNAELDFGAIDVPEAEEAILNIPFTALAESASGTDDEFTLAWNQ